MSSPSRLSDEPEAQTIVVDRRFRGPGGSGHGGYFAGLLNARVPGAGPIFIKLPIPLDTPLRLSVEDGITSVYHDESKIAWSTTRLGIDRPAPPSLAQAGLAASRFPGFNEGRHPFPECFGCGPSRTVGEGLRVFVGQMDGRQHNGRPIQAGTWRPDMSLLDSQGHLPAEFVWAALDCPGGWALEEKVSTQVLQVDTFGPLAGDQDLIITSWIPEPDRPSSRGGHPTTRRYVGSALYDCRGRLLALCTAVWVIVGSY